MQRTQTCGASLILAAVLPGVPAAQSGDLAAEFKSPPATAKPHTFWYWMGGQPWNKDSPLFESGLLGPATIQHAQ